MQEDTCSFHPMKTHRNSMGRVDICKNPVVNSWSMRKLPGPFCTSRAAVCGCFLDVHISQAWCWRNFWKKKSSNMFFFMGIYSDSFKANFLRIVPWKITIKPGFGRICFKLFPSVPANATSARDRFFATEVALGCGFGPLEFPQIPYLELFVWIFWWGQ